MKKILLPEEKAPKKRGMVLVFLAAFIATLALAPWDHIIKKRPDEQTLVDIRWELGQIRGQLDTLSSRYAERVTVTGYNSVREQTDSTPRITAINTGCREGVVAVSRDLLERGWTFGSKIWIEGYGVYTIEDVMNSRHRNHIDIWLPGKSKINGRDHVLAVVIR